MCGLADDSTFLVVDWLLLACRAAGLVAQATPLAPGRHGVHGMYVEVAGTAELERALGGSPWGAVDLLVAGEHLELARAIGAGLVAPDVTTVVSSSRRSFSSAERAVAPQHVLAEAEIDALATSSARAYHGFDGPEVARWYGLPSAAEPGLLFGAVCGSGAVSLDPDTCAEAIAALGIAPDLHVQAFGRGLRLGRHRGGRLRRPRTAYQFTRRRRAVIDRASRAAFEQLVARADEIVAAPHVPMLQDAIFLLCQFQDAEWAGRLVEHIAEIAAAERACCGAVVPEASVVPDAIRSLAGMLAWPDAAWVADRKRSSARLRAIRAAHGVRRTHEYELVDHVPLDADDRRALLPGPLARRSSAVTAPALLRPTRVERIRTSSARGAYVLRRLAASAARRPGSPQQRRELDTVEAWLQTLHETLRTDHDLARIVARSGTLVQGSGAIRDANRATAETFWGRVVRQTIAIDRSAPSGVSPVIAARVVPFVWSQLCRSGPLALWEYATPLLQLALTHARGLPYGEAVTLADELCAPRRTAMPATPPPRT